MCYAAEATKPLVEPSRDQEVDAKALFQLPRIAIIYYKSNIALWKYYLHKKNRNLTAKILARRYPIPS